MSNGLYYRQINLRGIWRSTQKGRVVHNRKKNPFTLKDWLRIYLSIYPLLFYPEAIVEHQELLIEIKELLEYIFGERETFKGFSGGESGGAGASGEF